MSEPTDKTQPKQRSGLIPFKKGVSGNPKGRPKGARSRLGETFVQALVNDFDEHGENVIRQVRMRDPVSYAKLIAGILPREVLVQAFTAHASLGPTTVAEAKQFLAAYRLVRDAPIEAEEGAIVTDAWCADD